MACIAVPFLNPTIAAVYNEINEVTGFDLTEEDLAPFDYFMRFLRRPGASELYSWRTDEKNRHWFDKVFKIVSDTQLSLCCVKYHYENIYRLELQVRAAVEKHDYRTVLGERAVFAGGDTKKLDFEYQAFVLAYRRCLEYLALGLCAYFHIKSSSFRKMPKTLQNVRKRDRHVAEALIKVHQAFKEEFSFVLSSESRPSTRDRISHYEYVSAGVVNLTPQGFVLAGGGEDLSRNTVHLTQVLSNRLISLCDCISQLIHAFVDSIESGPNVGAEPLR